MSTMIAEYDWENETVTPPPARTAFRQAVADIAAKATAKLPECLGRIDKAVALVLAGDVELLPDGTARVYSQANGIESYLVVNGHCDCKDYARAPSQWCKHRIAHGIQMRVQARMPQPAATHSLEPQKAGAQSLPEAPASANVRLTVQGFDVQVTLRDFSEARLMIRLEELLQTYGKVQPQAPASSPASPAPPPVDATPQQHNAMAGGRSIPGWCKVHDTAMKLNEGKDGRTWYSHFDEAAGRWCKGR